MNILGLATDIVECLRIAQLIERHGEQFLARVFTPHEIEYCHSRKAATQHFAATWAGKEAVLKALGQTWSQSLTWRDIEIRQKTGKQPVVALAGGARDVFEQLGAAKILISLAQCRTHAVGYAMTLSRAETNGSAAVSDEDDVPF